MQAVIIAGGEGTRLRPLTSTVPKPLLPVANRPMIARVVDLLVANGIRDIVVTVAYLGSAIRAYLGDGSDWGVRIRYLQEESPLGTAGAVANARHLLDDSFIVLSGDVVTSVDLAAAWRFHREHDALATMVLTTVADPTEFGVVATQDDGQVTRLIEKPSWGEVFTDTVNTGIYVLEPSVLDRIPSNRAVDFSEEVFPAILADREALFGYVAEGYWADVGTFAGFHQTHHDVLDGRAGIEPEGFELSPGVRIGARCVIDPSAVLEAPCLLGDDVRIGPGAHLGPYTVVGTNVRIGADSHLEGTIVFDHAWIGEGARLGRAIVGRGVDIRRRVAVHDGVVLGDGALVGRDAVVRADVRVYPGKTVEPLAAVSTSIVWESGAGRTVFGPLGISGLANVDINPELATRIAMAFASQLPPHGAVLAARDTSRAARIIKRAMMVGFNAVGLDVWDLEATTTPVLRHVVATTDAVAGIRVALDAADPQALTIELLGDHGADLTASERRKVERALEREEFRRVSASEIGDLELLAHATERWKAGVLALLDTDAIREFGFKAVLDYSYGVVASTFPHVAASLHLEALALRSFPSTKRLIDLHHEHQLAELATLVRGAKAHLGAIVDPGGERLLLTDARGRMLPVAGLAELLATHLARRGTIRRLVASAAMPSSLARLAGRLGIDFAWCGLGRADLASAVASTPNTLAIGHGGLVFLSGCTSSSDAAVTLGLALEALARADLDLASVVDATPTEITLTEEVPVPFALRGATMRGLREFAEREQPDELAAADGLRAQFSGRFWLLAPDPQEPVINVIVGAGSAQAAHDDLDRLRQEVARLRDEAASQLRRP